MINNLVKTLVCSVAGTTVMTLTSALMSIKGQDFREPKHLSKLAKKLLPFLPKEYSPLVGWVGHYGMGAAFAAVYVALWERKVINHSLLTGSVLGGVSGLVGFLIWKATFKIQPLSPMMNYNKFYLQRMPVHVVFAVFATLAYQQIKRYEERKIREINSPSDSK